MKSDDEETDVYLIYAYILVFVLQVVILVSRSEGVFGGALVENLRILILL